MSDIRTMKRRIEEQILSQTTRQQIETTRHRQSFPTVSLISSGNRVISRGPIVDTRSSMSRYSLRILAPRKRVGDKLLKQLRLASWPFAVGASLGTASGRAGGRRGVQAT